MHTSHLFRLSLGLCCLLACNRHVLPEMEAEDEKLAPYEFFAFQRSYPDPYFDWFGWRRTLSELRAEAAVADQAKILNGCNTAQPTGNWTLQGPANVGGRVNTLATKPGDDLTVLAGFSGGGIFKSTDGGVNWHPVFDDNPELCIGDITYDPNNPNVVYAGTGDPNVPGIVFNGNGLYKSIDGGETWNYLGLSEVGIISKVLVDPSNSQILFVASMGTPYIRDNNRGIYKSTDGGATWQKILFITNETGASDLVMDPTNPQILYASFWDRIRNNYESLVSGMHGRVYKTTDGGANWTMLGGGLPTWRTSRSGLAISAQNPNKLYAVFVDSTYSLGGIYRTTNGGASWTSISIAGLTNAYSNFGWYFGKIRLNPTNDEELYLLAVLLWQRNANTGVWQRGAGGHSDSHDLVITPSGARYWANDGGVYRRAVGQSSFTKCNNLPTTQLYHVDFNPHFPNTYFIGAQDNGIQKGSGAAINNWTPLFFADGFNSVFLPADSNTFWVETQYGTIHKTTDGGDSWIQGDEALGTGERVSWDAPIFMSTHNPPKRFAATYRVYQTVSDFWTDISGDLTDGPIFPDALHTISALNESPLVAEKLYAGTTDGNVWIREPGGAWVDITAGLPDRYVTSVHGSTTQADRLFVTHSGFKDNDDIPHIHRSDNNGSTWVDISGNLPQLPVNDLYIKPGQNDNTIFAATDGGMYYTVNGGQQWARLGSNMPFIPVFDVEYNPVRKEIMAATHARGLWTFPIDSVTAPPVPVTVAVSGTVRNESGTGIAQVQLNTPSLGQTTTAGAYTLPAVPGCQSFTLRPYRNDQPVNGVSTFDLALIAKHILGYDTLESPLKILAADANRSGSVTTFDIVALRRLILGIDTAFAQNTSWRFFPQGISFPNPIYPFNVPLPDSITLALDAQSVSGLGFVGIKVGDVNGTANPSLGPENEPRSNHPWQLHTDRVTWQRGDTVLCALTGDVLDLEGLQFSLRFDPAVLQWQGVNAGGSSITPEHFGLNRTAEGILTFAWEPGAAPDKSFYIVLKFKALKEGSVETTLSVGDSPTASCAYTQAGDCRPVQLAIETSVSASGDFYPNPLPPGENLKWVVPADCAGKTIRFEWWSVAGQKIHEETVRVGAAGNVQSFSGQWPSSPGVYYCKVVDKVGNRLLFTSRVLRL